jgi:PIN domain nuclease of toxin-antitoxin system
MLLDTHVLLWIVLTPERISPRVRRALADQKNEIWLSPITVWESLLLLKNKRVKISSNTGESAWLQQAIEGIPFREAAITRQVAFATGEVILEHQDPADRFLAATAAVYDLTLVTADEKLLRGKGFKSLAAA